MPRYTDTQLASLNQIGDTMMTLIRAVMRDENAGDPAAVAGSWNRLRVDFGRDGAIHLMRSWLDQVVEACPHVNRGDQVLVGFADPDGARLEAPGQQSVEYQWAAGALAARFGDDNVALYRLFDMLPHGDTFLDFLLRTAVVCAGVLNAYEVRPDAPYAPGDVFGAYIIGVLE